MLFFIHENNIIFIKYLLSLYIVRETALLSLDIGNQIQMS